MHVLTEISSSPLLQSSFNIMRTTREGSREFRGYGHWKCTAVHRDVCDAPRLRGALPGCMCVSLFVCAREPGPAEKNCDHHSTQRLELCNDTV